MTYLDVTRFGRKLSLLQEDISAAAAGDKCLLYVRGDAQKTNRIGHAYGASGFRDRVLVNFVVVVVGRVEEKVRSQRLNIKLALKIWIQKLRKERSRCF